MLETIKEYWFLINGLLIPFLFWIFTQYKNIKSELNQSKQNDVVIMRDLLLANYDKCKERGYCTETEREHFLDMCDKYFVSNGNLFVHDLKDRFLKLEIKDD